jgi:hypothetical protein
MNPANGTKRAFLLSINFLVYSVLNHTAVSKAAEGCALHCKFLIGESIQVKLG